MATVAFVSDSHPGTGVLLLIAFFGVFVVDHGSRLLTDLSVLRSLPRDDMHRYTGVSSDRAVLTGTLSVDTPVETASRVTNEEDHEVGAYLWRACYADNTNESAMISSYGWEEQRWLAFDSGIEWGDLTVKGGGRRVRLDTAWLRDSTDAEPLEKLSISKTLSTDRFVTSLWESPYTYLREAIEHRSFEQFSEYVREIG